MTSSHCDFSSGYSCSVAILPDMMSLFLCSR